MAIEDDDAMLVGDFKGFAAFAPMKRVPNAALTGVNVDHMLDIVETEIGRWRSTAAGIGYHAGIGFGKADLRDESA